MWRRLISVRPHKAEKAFRSVAVSVDRQVGVSVCQEVGEAFGALAALDTFRKI
jgi:hypothetical protein